MAGINPPSCQTPREAKSTFQRALERYINGLSEKERKKNFIAVCYDPSNPITAESVSNFIRKIEVDQSHKSSTISKLIKKVVNALKDYDGLINSLASADPMPTAIIWGALSVVINSAQRHFGVFDMIKKELRKLANELERIAEYEDLFGDSTKLQRLLCDSYINIFRFWNRVHKELTKPGFGSAAFVAFSSCSKKLNAILEEIGEDADEIEKEANLLSQKKAQEEQEKANRERAAQSGWRKKQEEEQMRRTVSDWLQRQKVTSADLNRHEEFQSQRMDGTCDWLMEYPYYSSWREDTTSSPIICLYAPPGSGKSTLCSRVIQSIERSDASVAVAYHFYRFDEPFRALEVLQHFAYQLFRKFSGAYNSGDILKDLANKVEVQGEVAPLQCTRELLVVLVKSLPRTYFFLDGLDEESAIDRWKDAETVVDFLQNLSHEYPRATRIWSSSQNVACVQEKFKAHRPLEGKEPLKADMMFYLSSEMAKLDVSEADKTSLLQHLKARAAGNFLWANLMMKDLERANSPADMTRIVEEGPTLDDYYKKFFERIEANDVSLACYIFALVAFARRPLKIKELREAIGLLKSRDAASQRQIVASLNRAEIPYVRRLLKLFPPLIEVENISDNLDDDRICRLCHSTVLDFLRRNPYILRSSLKKGVKDLIVGVRICPRVMADACLQYLSQERYSRLLIRRENGWFDANEDPVAEHHFLTYSAKYWDKHLDSYPHRVHGLFRSLSSTEPDGQDEEFGNQRVFLELHGQVEQFLRSPNFQTCLQVQSLWVDGHFSIHHIFGDAEDRGYVKRVFPDWFIMLSPDGMAFLKNYHRLWYDWRLVLNCGTCADPDCVVKPYAGEIDRCWWAALGSQNFLSNMKSRYSSFRFQANAVDHGRKPVFEGLAPAGDALTILRLNSYCDGQLYFDYEQWTLSGDGPALQKTQIIIVGELSTNWLQYMKFAVDNSKFSKPRDDRALAVSFSQDCLSFRIGSQIYAADDKDDFTSILALCDKQGQHSYVDEFTRREHLLALATRRGTIADPKLQDLMEIEGTSNMQNSTKSEMESPPSKFRQKDEEWNGGSSDEDSSSLDGHDESATSNESDDNAYESWSDCSSASENSQFEDNMVALGRGQADDSGTSDSSDSESLKKGNADLKSPGNSNPSSDGSSESSSEDSDVDPRAFSYKQIHTYGDEDSDNEEGLHITLPSRKKRRKSDALSPPKPNLSITVFDTRPPVPETIFHFSRKFQHMLYDSPPAIHPSQPLLVWPLGGGDILFADLSGNTYFIRKLRPSTPHTRHLFMKFHFSDCGRFLHVAALEGQPKPVAKSKRRKGADPSMNLALMVLTYRLCKRLAARSPPFLIHRTRVQLGLVASLSVSTLPYTLSWTPKELYLTSRGVTLQVYRVHLFNCSNLMPSCQLPAVTRPRETIFLPCSAEERNVYYFPPTDGSMTGRIIVGSESLSQKPLNRVVMHDESRNLSPPIGCFVDEQKDLGGWMDSSDRTKIQENRSVGRLDRPLEQFNPEEDCDLQAFLFLG